MYNLLINIAWFLSVIGSLLVVAIGLSVGLEKEGCPRVFGYQMSRNFQYLKRLVREERAKGNSIKYRFLTYATFTVYLSVILLIFIAGLIYFV